MSAECTKVSHARLENVCYGIAAVCLPVTLGKAKIAEDRSEKRIQETATRSDQDSPSPPPRPYFRSPLVEMSLIGYANTLVVCRLS